MCLTAVAFVSTQLEIDTQLDPRYYKVAKELWKKKNWRRLKEPIVIKVEPPMLDRKSSTNSHSMAEFSQNFMKTGTPKVKIFPTAPPVYYEEVEEEFKPIQVEEVIKTPVFTGRGLGLHGVKPISIKINPSPVSRRESGVTFGVATPLLPPNKSSQRNRREADSSFLCV